MAVFIVPVIFTDGSDASGGARIGDDEYGSVSEALAASVPGDLVFAVPGDDGTLQIEGSLLVPAYVTLILPYSEQCDSSGTKDGESMETTSPKTSADRYMTLTVPKGSSLTVDGTLIVGGVLSRPFAFDYQGHTSGPFAQLTVNGSVEVRDGGSLYCYGFIKGTGTVHARAGASVYEPMVVTDYVGGDMAYCNYSNGQSPFSRYAMYNIQSKYSMEYGAVLYGMVNLYANGTNNKGMAPVVGPDAGLLLMSEGSTLTSTYNSSEYVQGDWESNIYRDIGKKHVVLKKGASTGSITIDVQGNHADTATVMFSVPYNYDFTLSDGEYVIKDKFRFLPGSGLTVSSDATLVVRGTLLVYDGLTDHEFRDKFYPDAGLLGEYRFDKIAKLVVDGTMNVQGTFAGPIQTTKAGSKVITGMGSVLSLQAKYGADGSIGMNSIKTVTVKQMQAYIYKPSGDRLSLSSGRTYTSVDAAEHVIESFQYTDKVDNKSYTVRLDQKITGSWESEPLRITYDANRGDGEAPVDPKSYTEGDKAVILGPGSLSKANSEFLGWSLRSDSKSNLIMPGDEYSMRGDVTLYAAWTVGYFYITAASTSMHGTVMQGEKQETEEHGTVLVSILPDAGYRVKEVSVDGRSNGESNVIRFEDVTASHSVRIQFEEAEGTTSSAAADGSVTEKRRIADGSAVTETEKICDAYGNVEYRVRCDGGAGAAGEATNSSSGAAFRIILSPVPSTQGGRSVAVVTKELMEEAVALVEKAAGLANAVYTTSDASIVVDGASASACEIRIGHEEFLALAAGGGLDVQAGGWEAHIPNSILRTIRNAVRSPEVSVSMSSSGTHVLSLVAAGEVNPSAGPEYSRADDLVVKKDGWTVSIPASLAVRMVRSGMTLEFGNVKEAGSVSGDLRCMSFSASETRKVPTPVSNVSFSSPDG
ncbi:MAG: InlB B-repeat-containing protein, partial [Candidatus Methanomethylophilaceae archaeon]|nr:InlB B-repeat-containing protein [Candidatus Methanomethylophilaceae archaeon]